MPDSRKKRGPEDGRYIALNEEWERRYWCKRFRCTPQELDAAVRKTGHGVHAVSKALGFEFPPVVTDADPVTAEPPGGTQI